LTIQDDEGGLIAPKEGGPLSDDEIINLDFLDNSNEEMEDVADDVTNVEKVICSC
jgi:hypothetical protein